METQQRGRLEVLSDFMNSLPCNDSTGHQSVTYNFSTSDAMRMILQFRNSMFTIDNPTTIALLCLYIPTFLIGLGGNVLVIYVVFCNRNMRKAKNIYLANLAIADVFVTVLCIPMVVCQSIYRLWIFNQLLCKLTGYMQGVSVMCSIFTLCALSMDRYFIFRKPTSCRKVGAVLKLNRTALIIWLLAAVLSVHLFYIRDVKFTKFDCLDVEFQYCIEDWPSHTARVSHGVAIVVFLYIIPISLIAICYGLIGSALWSTPITRNGANRSTTLRMGRQRVARMMIALVFLFVVCWLPYNVMSLILDVSDYYIISRMLPFTLWLAHAHSALNPLFYWYLNKTFRHSMNKVLFCRTSQLVPRSTGDRV